MFCITCGKQLDEGSAFCRHCGTNQAADSKAVVATATSQLAKVAKSEFMGLRAGERVMGLGALLAAISFFLPWAKTPEQAGFLFGGERGSNSIGGPGLMKLWGGVVFVLVLPLVSLFLLYLSKSATPGRKVFLAGFQSWIGGSVGPQLIMAMLFVPLASNVLSTGAWGLGLGYSAILVGALMLLGDLGRQTTA